MLGPGMKRPPCIQQQKRTTLAFALSCLATELIMMLWMRTRKMVNFIRSSSDHLVADFKHLNHSVPSLKYSQQIYCFLVKYSICSCIKKTFVSVTQFQHVTIKFCTTLYLMVNIILLNPYSNWFIILNFTFMVQQL